MNTPIWDFVHRYAASAPLRLHMPGHKGKSVLGVETADITEIPGADVLYHPQGIILESERNASRLFGTARTVYSAEGSSLPIRAMLYLVSLYAAVQGRRPIIAAGRNAHKVFITAAALLNLEVQWLYPAVQDDLISCILTPEEVEAHLHACAELPAAVYITSPDYLGNVADIRGISAVCRRYGCLLLVDNAHGAYLQFLPESRHPMQLGADLCCDSAHKTLPVLTGGAYLHISRTAPAFLSEMADQAMALFASTSPSYLILQSLDRANADLAGGFRERLADAISQWDALRRELTAAGWMLAGQEPLKLTVLPKSYGYTGDELAEILEKQNIYCEFADPDHLVLMLPATSDSSVRDALSQAFSAIPGRAPITDSAPILRRAVPVLTPHQAIFKPSVTIPAAQSQGRIMASPSVSCPPAIPIVVCGERIDRWAVEAMQYYGIESVLVIQE